MSRTTLRPRPVPKLATKVSERRELDALGSFLSGLEQLRARAAGLALRCSRRIKPDAPPAIAALGREVQALHARVEALLQEAARNDRVRLRPLRPLDIQDPEGSMIGECRRVAHDLEEQCAAESRHAQAMGLLAIAGALSDWRRELIGLERPLIAAHAEQQAFDNR